MCASSAVSSSYGVLSAIAVPLMGFSICQKGQPCVFHLQWSKPSAEATIPWVCCSDADIDEPDHVDIAA